MAHFLHLALRALAGIAGATAIYAALFLYEDEQGKIENRLNEWWIRLDDRQLIDNMESGVGVLRDEDANAVPKIVSRPGWWRTRVACDFIGSA
jgi:hypothetical protein